MLFNSISFLLFFPLVFAIYYLAPVRWRWLVLLLASYYFYMYWSARYALILVLQTVLDYVCALRMQSVTGVLGRRVWLWISIVSNLSLLIFFKYFNFIAESVGIIAHELQFDLTIPILQVLLPLGLSFHTFQSIAYCIDVYRGNCLAERHFGRFALFICFFPQLVAGPIERASEMLPQIRTLKEFDPAVARAGLALMLWGIIQKVVIADRLAPIVNQVYASPGLYTRWQLLLAIYCFSFQILYDFAGYTNIALGSAKVLGFELRQNFIRPYLSRSVTEFWRRWHVTLSQWFRDYLYLPLGGDRRGNLIYLRNIMIVFVLSGLWHGAGWGFIIWGMLHGCFVIIERLSGIVQKRVARAPSVMRNIILMVVTFHFVTLAWIFFRAPNLTTAYEIITCIIGTSPGVAEGTDLNLRNGYLFETGVLLLFVLIIEMLQEYANLPKLWRTVRPGMRWALAGGIVLLLITFGEFSKTQFIYFQF